MIRAARWPPRYGRPAARSRSRSGKPNRSIAYAPPVFVRRTG